MGGFFRKGGNTRGVFTDFSNPEESSLFTNDDERGGASCPCSIEDNPIHPVPPRSCSVPEPVILPAEPQI